MPRSLAIAFNLMQMRLLLKALGKAHSERREKTNKDGKEIEIDRAFII